MPGNGLGALRVGFGAQGFWSVGVATPTSNSGVNGFGGCCNLGTPGIVNSIQLGAIGFGSTGMPSAGAGIGVGGGLGWPGTLHNNFGGSCDFGGVGLPLSRAMS